MDKMKREKGWNMEARNKKSPETNLRAWYEPIYTHFDR